MTIQELIDILSNVEDKNAVINIFHERQGFLTDIKDLGRHDSGDGNGTYEYALSVIYNGY